MWPSNKLGKDDQLQLFKLLMKDKAADWLRALPEHKKAEMDLLTRVFITRHKMLRVEKWRQKAEIWERKQGPTECVDDYVAAMQAAVRRIDMPEIYLADAIMQGLQTELRLHVLHSKAKTTDGSEAARVSEVAYSVNTASSSQMDTLNATVGLLLMKMVANSAKTEDQTITPMKVWQ
jgi:hypothetical protein